ncbi:MAG: thioredoxin domain-containing protein [Syntrophobacterales bacterium]|nr:thioredoxin domain-containing protein [Syntrophobacterales bacterium]
MANRLEKEKSPYLLQHAANPVDWFPWSDEAFARAAAEDKPVFLSVGYATCHWCHVMAHESFEDHEVADRLNRDFVAIKVDREERPDLDQIYMTVCQAMTGRGGWPLSVFMTPERRPFFAGTYFPKENRLGMTGFISILEQISGLWKNQRRKVLDNSATVIAALQPFLADTSRSSSGLDQTVLAEALGQLKSVFDATWGGFGTAPKFPTPHQLTFLLRRHQRTGSPAALEMVEKSLVAMRHGGIFDQIGFGFHRYSVDQQWLTPHFEKMLYDQAMLAMAYVEAYQVTGKPFYAAVVREIFEYVERDLGHPQGAFTCAEDADSEGREGLFYLWQPDQVRTVLGEELGDLTCRFYDVSTLGNFEDGFSIPHITKSREVFSELSRTELPVLEERLETARKRLFAERRKRVRPLLDDKVLASWNGLMIAALAKGYQALGDTPYLQAANRAADFVLERLRPDGRRLYRRWRDGEAAHPGFLDDYAFLIWGLLELYQAEFDPLRLEQAIDLQQQMIALFHDPETGGFYFSGSDGEALIVRDKEIHDGALPSGNSVAIENLLRLSRLTGNTRWEELAEQGINSFAELVRGYPMAYTQFLQAVDFSLGPTLELVVVGRAAAPDTGAMLRLIQSVYCPRKSVHWLNGDPVAEQRLMRLAPHLESLQADGGPRVYLCEGFSCQQPLRSLAELKRALAVSGPSGSPQQEQP